MVSTEVGKLIVQVAAGNLKMVTLELGGKSPNIVFDDAESGAVEGTANAIFFNHGQCRVAGCRLFVQEDRFDEVVNGVAEIAKGIKRGPGMEAGTQMGPLVSDEQLRRVTGFLESGVSEGATTVTGGGGNHPAVSTIEAGADPGRPPLRLLTGACATGIRRPNPGSARSQSAANAIGQCKTGLIRTHGLAGQASRRADLKLYPSGLPS